MKTLFEELVELRAKLEKRPRVRLSTLASIDALLARHRESERWHYQAEGEVPGERVDVLTCRDRADGKAHHNIECRYDGDWCGLDRWRTSAPTRWRHLSPADVPEAE